MVRKKLIRPHLQPYQLINSTDQVANAQWDDIVNKIKQKAYGRFSRSMAIVDVSGSMCNCIAENTQAITVAVSLGLLVAETSQVADRRVITFSANPSFVSVPQGTLTEKVGAIKSMPWGMNTNFHAVFKALIKEKIDIDTLFVFSDMQFDDAATNTYPHNQIKEDYRLAEMTMPQIVYWNLSAVKTALPITMNDYGNVMISGFSSKLFDLFMTDMPFDPMTILRQTLDKYDGIIPEPFFHINQLVDIDWNAVTEAITHPKGRSSVQTEEIVL